MTLYLAKFNLMITPYLGETKKEGPFFRLIEAKSDFDALQILNLLQKEEPYGTNVRWIDLDLQPTMTMDMVE